MKLILKTTILLVMLSLFACGGGSLMSKEALQEKQQFEGLEAAKESPNKVYRLQVKFKKAEEATELVQFPNLQELTVFGPKLTEVPAAIGKVPNLQDLIMELYAVEAFPDWLFEMKQLRTLHLSSKANKIPSEIKQLSNLEMIFIAGSGRFYEKDSGVKISELPDEIKKLKNLTTFWSVSQLFTEVPEVLGDMPQLERLIIASSGITKIYDNIGDIDNLEILDLGNNQIETLPNSIANLKNLRELTLNKNNISIVPDFIYEMKHLEKLDLRDNKISREDRAKLKAAFPKRGALRI